MRTHDTAPTQFIEANGIRFAYRRFGPAARYADRTEHALSRNHGPLGPGDNRRAGEEPGGDPVRQRRHRCQLGRDAHKLSPGGVGRNRLHHRARDRQGRCARLLHCRQDRTGGRRPGARSGAQTHPGGNRSSRRRHGREQVGRIFARRYDPPEHLWLAVHFSSSAAGRAAGLAYLERKLRRKDRSPEVTEKSAAAQLEAIAKSNEKTEGVLNYLKDIRQPALVVGGSNDLIIPTINSYVLQQNLPNAQLIIYPDSNHAPFYQYPELFLAHAQLFLNG